MVVFLFWCPNGQTRARHRRQQKRHHVFIHDKVFGNAHLPVIAWHTSETSDWAALGWCVDTFLPKCRAVAAGRNRPAKPTRLPDCALFLCLRLSTTCCRRRRLPRVCFLRLMCNRVRAVGRMATRWGTGGGEGQDGGIEDTEGKTMRKREGGWG